MEDLKDLGLELVVMAPTVVPKTGPAKFTKIGNF